MTFDEVTAERIGVTWLRTALAPWSEFGRRAAEAERAFGPGDEARAVAAAETVLARASLLRADGVTAVRAALRAAPNPATIVARARAGDPLDDVDFYELGRFADALAAIGAAWRGAGGGDDGAPPPPGNLATLLAPGRDGRGFTLVDAFDPRLAAARRDLDAAEVEFSEARAAANARIAALLEIAIDGDEFVLLRDRFPGPLPEGVRVLREAPAYRLCAPALDARGVDAANAREVAFEALATIESEVRRALAERVAAEATTIDAATVALGELDRSLARVAFTQRWSGCVPTFGTAIRLEGALNAPLAEALIGSARRYDPIDLAFENVAVLTGPNMGGKSAALATIGFVALCIAYGVPPPARGATLPLFARIEWIGGDSGTDDRLLSSFGAEVLRARDALRAPERPLLVLADEFARTTNPREGRALLVAFAQAVHVRGMHALLATHFGGVAAAAGLTHLRIAGADDAALAAIPAAGLAEALEAVGAAMDYRPRPVDPGTAPPADALALARILGLDPEVVAAASALARR